MDYRRQDAYDEYHRSTIRRHEGFCTYYMPLQASIGFSIMSIPTLDQKVASLIFFNMDPTKILMTNTIIGTTLYLATRSYVKRFHKADHISYSIVGGIMFPFAAMYGWKLCSQVLPDIPVINSVFGIITAYYYMKLCRRYTSLIELFTSNCAVTFFGVPIESD